MTAQPAHILVVDDDDRLRSLLKRYLSQSGFGVTVARDAAVARNFLDTLTFDLVILDVMMPGEDGFSLLSGMRERLDTPAIMLTARTDSDDRISGLKRGADDYLSKPFEPEELQLRINAILRRSGSEEVPDIVRMSGLEYHVEKAELRRNGRPVRLTESEAQLLRILAGRSGDPITRHELAQQMSAGAERTVDVQVTRLRRKIEPDPREPVYLQTVRGVGYRLTGD